jgi:hypothetical protein
MSDATYNDTTKKVMERLASLLFFQAKRDGVLLHVVKLLNSRDFHVYVLRCLGDEYRAQFQINEIQTTEIRYNKHTEPCLASEHENLLSLCGEVEKAVIRMLHGEIMAMIDKQRIEYQL